MLYIELAHKAQLYRETYIAVLNSLLKEPASKRQFAKNVGIQLLAVMKAARIRWQQLKITERFQSTVAAKAEGPSRAWLSSSREWAYGSRSLSLSLTEFTCLVK